MKDKKIRVQEAPQHKQCKTKSKHKSGKDDLIKQPANQPETSYEPDLDREPDQDLDQESNDSDTDLKW